jgi:hypothetical protein
MTTNNSRSELSKIARKASQIAGACWDDREVEGSLGDQLRAVATTPATGSDGDLDADDRGILRYLADQADDIDRVFCTNPTTR